MGDQRSLLGLDPARPLRRCECCRHQYRRAGDLAGAARDVRCVGGRLVQRQNPAHLLGVRPISTPFLRRDDFDGCHRRRFYADAQNQCQRLTSVAKGGARPSLRCERGWSHSIGIRPEAGAALRQKNVFSAWTQSADRGSREELAPLAGSERSGQSENTKAEISALVAQTSKANIGDPRIRLRPKHKICAETVL